MIKDRIKELRVSIKYTQSKLGDFLGVSQQAVGKWEAGIAEPDSELLVKMAKLFDVSIDYIIGASENAQTLHIPEEYKNLPVAFYEGAKGLTQDDIDDVVKFMEYKKHLRG